MLGFSIRDNFLLMTELVFAGSTFLLMAELVFAGSVIITN